MLDSYWLTAIQFLAAHLKDEDTVLAPNAFKEHFGHPKISNYRATFLGLPEQFFSLAVVHKGTLNRIQPSFLEAIDASFVPVFANEVFVIFSRSFERFSHISPDSPHLKAYWDERQQMTASTHVSEPSNLNDASTSDNIEKTPLMLGFVPDIDVLLCSYRKCGRTWLRFILSFYINELCQLNYVPSWETMWTLVPPFKLIEAIPLETIRIDHYAGKQGLKAIAVSHHNYATPNAPAILDGKDIIFLFRSVGDVLVSQYFERVFRRDFHPRDSVWAFIQAEQLLEAYVNYLNAWASNIDNHRHLTVTYEEMKRDTAGAVSRILHFIGADVDNDVLAHAIELSSFDSMQKMERKELGMSETSNETASLRTRRGKIGGYRDYLSDEAVSTIRRYCGDRLSPKARQLFDQHQLNII